MKHIILIFVFAMSSAMACVEQSSNYQCSVEVVGLGVTYMTDISIDLEERAPNIFRMFSDLNLDLFAVAEPKVVYTGIDNPVSYQGYLSIVPQADCSQNGIRIVWKHYEKERQAYSEIHKYQFISESELMLLVQIKSPREKAKDQLRANCTSI